MDINNLEELKEYLSRKEQDGTWYDQELYSIVHCLIIEIESIKKQ